MSITINDNLSVNAPKPTDSRYLNESTLTVYPNVTAVNTAIVPSRRYLGLTVLIAEGGGQNVEYWYKDGVGDSDLVLKQAGGGGASVIVSADEPATPNEGDMWLDTSDDTLKIHDGSGWISINTWDAVNGTADSVPFTITAPNGAPTKGVLAWDGAEETLSLGLAHDSVLQLGQETLYHVQNASTTTPIADGTPVMYSGTVGNSGRMYVTPWSGNVADVKKFMGLATGPIPPRLTDADTGYVTHFGKVRGIKTDGDGLGETWSSGQILYLKKGAGGLTNVAPTAPGPRTIVALVLSAHSNNGTLFVRVTHGSNLGDDELVQLSGLADKHALLYDGATSRFVNRAIVSADVSDATASATADTIAKRDDEGGLSVAILYAIQAVIDGGENVTCTYNGHNISYSYAQENFGLTLSTPTTITANRIVTFPDATGTLALTSRTDGVPDNIIPNNAATTRTNLGLGTTNDVSFNSVTVDGAGGIYLSGLQTWGVFSGATGINFRFEGNGSIPFVVGYSGARLNGSSTLSWSQTSTAGTDLFLARDAANTLAQRNGTNAQTFRLYNTYTDPANYERLRLSAVSGSNFILGTEKGSAGGTARGLQIRTDSETNAEFPVTGGITTPFIKVTGTTADSSSGLKFLDSATSRYVDLKMASTLAADAIVRLPVVSGTLRVSASEIFTGTGGADSAATVTNGVDYYFSSAQSASGLLYTPAAPSAGDVIEFTIDNRTGGAGPEQNVLIYQLSPLTLVATVPAGFRRVVLSYNGTSWSSSVTKATALTSRTDGVPDNIIPNNAETTRTNLGLGTTNSPTFANVYVPFNGTIGFDPVNKFVFGSGTIRAIAGHATNSGCFIYGSTFSIPNNGYFGWSSTQAPNGAVDLTVYRDEANVLAQRNGTNAQTFRLYRTYTSASSYQRLTLSTAADAFNFTAESTSTSNLDINLLPQGTGKTKTTNLDATGDITASGGAGEVDINSLYGSGLQFRSVEALVSGMSGATAATSTIIPAGALVLGVVVRVTTAVAGPPNFKVGIASVDDDKWGATVPIALNSATTSASFTDGAPMFITSPTAVTLTANGPNFSAGAVRVCVHYLQISQLTA